MIDSIDLFVFVRLVVSRFFDRSMASSQSPLIPPSSDSFRTSSDHYENPYYLHDNDHAGSVLVTDRLTTASDFHSWK